MMGSSKPNIDSQCEAAGVACMKDGNFIGPVTARLGVADLGYLSFRFFRDLPILVSGLPARAQPLKTTHTP